MRHIRIILDNIHLKPLASPTRPPTFHERKSVTLDQLEASFRLLQDLPKKERKRIT